jgi:hypothetical protein
MTVMGAVKHAVRVGVRQRRALDRWPARARLRQAGISALVALRLYLRGGL